MSRIEMINSLTGMTMSVPVELVEKYEKAGHKIAVQAQSAEEDESQETPEGPKKNKK